MATFKVGQRVRLVHPVFPENMNKTGTVKGHKFYKKGTINKAGQPLPFDVDLVVNLDDEQIDRATASWQLEPIVDDGRKVMDWDALNELGLSADKLLDAVKERVKEKA